MQSHVPLHIVAFTHVRLQTENLILSNLKSKVMLLKNKNAVIYGAGGSLGGAFARAFADAGATLYITGHRVEPVQQLANEINAAGGKAFVAKVDAMNEQQVNEYLSGLVADGNSIDI